MEKLLRVMHEDHLDCHTKGDEKRQKVSDEEEIKSVWVRKLYRVPRRLLHRVRRGMKCCVFGVKLFG